MTTITVTQADIDAGVSCNACSCPVALALKRAFPGRSIRVEGDFSTIGGELVTLPDIALVKICNYDDTERMTPFSFPINL